MKQVVQPLRGGPVKVIDVPRPTITATEVLVQTIASVVSPGTERALTSLAQSSLLAKARARPDLVRQVIRKAKNEGLAQTMRSVRSRMDEDLPLGYSAVGIAREVGEAVARIKPGDLVATAGAGKANHAEFQAVPGHLCCPVPEGVPTDDAAFATIASIALHSFRLAEVGPGSRVVVLGLGLVGQLAVRVAQASGCQVAGIDIASFPIEVAGRTGALALKEAGESTTEAIISWSRWIGADAVLVTAGGKSSDAIMRVPVLCRDRASVVVIGDVGLELQRTSFYEKELSVRFARSYGPGRYEHSYEDWGVDYPIGYVRWTEGRNLEAVLDLMSSSRLAAKDLITHRFPIEEAARAYEAVMTREEPVLGITLDYAEPVEEKPILLRQRKKGTHLGVGLIGAGSFARSVLIPAFRRAGFDRLVSVTSASGVSARNLAERAGFDKAVSGADAVINDPEVEVVVIATPHDSHASLAAAALRVGKHVYCEKPLALSLDELEDIEGALAETNSLLFVGFNRRWSKAIELVKQHFGHPPPRMMITYRVNAGALSESHWYRDRRQGGRLIGEVCHFIDTCAALVGEPVSDVATICSGSDELLLSDNLIVLLRYLDGSLATIHYATSGDPAGEKEQVEVWGAGKSALISDFRAVSLDGRRASLWRMDKGHLNQVRAFYDQLKTGGSVDLSAIATTRTTLVAAASMSESGYTPLLPQ